MQNYAAFRRLFANKVINAKKVYKTAKITVSSDL